MKLMKKINGTALWQLDDKIANLLRICLPVEGDTKRPGISYIRAEGRDIVATDGRRMVIVNAKHSLAEGLYLLTVEGYLIQKKGETRYPAWRDVLYRQGCYEIACQGKSLDTEYQTDQIVWLCNHIGNTCLHLEFFLPPLRVLCDIGCYGVEIRYAKEGTMPIELHCACDADTKIIYVQMPVEKQEYGECIK